MASLVKAVRNGHGWLGIFTADVLPTADSVSSILVALLHDNCSACRAALVRTVAMRRAAECKFVGRSARCAQPRTAMAAGIYADRGVCLRLYRSSIPDRSVACGHP